MSGIPSSPHGEPSQWDVHPQSQQPLNYAVHLQFVYEVIFETISGIVKPGIRPPPPQLSTCNTTELLMGDACLAAATAGALPHFTKRDTTGKGTCGLLNLGIYMLQLGLDSKVKFFTWDVVFSSRWQVGITPQGSLCSTLHISPAVEVSLVPWD